MLYKLPAMDETVAFCINHIGPELSY